MQHYNFWPRYNIVGHWVLILILRWVSVLLFWWCVAMLEQPPETGEKLRRFCGSSLICGKKISGSETFSIVQKTKSLLQPVIYGCMSAKKSLFRNRFPSCEQRSFSLSACSRREVHGTDKNCCCRRDRRRQSQRENFLYFSEKHKRSNFVDVFTWFFGCAA